MVQILPSSNIRASIQHFLTLKYNQKNKEKVAAQQQISL